MLNCEKLLVLNKIQYKRNEIIDFVKGLINDNSKIIEDKIKENNAEIMNSQKTKDKTIEEKIKYSKKKIVGLIRACLIHKSFSNRALIKKISDVNIEWEKTHFQTAKNLIKTNHRKKEEDNIINENKIYAPIDTCDSQRQLNESDDNIDKTENKNVRKIMSNIIENEDRTQNYDIIQTYLKKLGKISVFLKFFDTFDLKKILFIEDDFINSSRFGNFSLEDFDNPLSILLLSAKKNYFISFQFI